MSWVAVEKALHDLVAAGAALAGGSVIWSYQNGPRPALPFVRLFHEDDHAYGLVDDAFVEDNPAPTAGAEILQQTNVQARFSLRIDVFSNAATGDASAAALAARIRDHLSQQSALDALDTAGLALIDRGRIDGMPAVIDEAFESRAMLVCQIGYSKQLTEPTTYIERVEGTVTVKNPNGAATPVPYAAP